jgi:hypothetical protein
MVDSSNYRLHQGWRCRLGAVGHGNITLRTQAPAALSQGVPEQLLCRHVPRHVDGIDTAAAGGGAFGARSRYRQNPFCSPL